MLLKKGVPLGVSIAMVWSVQTVTFAQEQDEGVPTSAEDIAEAAEDTEEAAEDLVESAEDSVESAEDSVESAEDFVDELGADDDSEFVAPPEDDDTEVVTITGSRIKRKTISTPAPVSVLNNQDIVAVGRPSIADVLQRLPSAANGINLQFNNGGNGAARINLRSLGAERTLVLVNGRRFVAGGSGANSSVDLNTIPTSMIERIEVLKDGGSAVYGSDAISGVVNIITKKDFEGVEATAFVSQTGRGDGRIYQVDVTGGLTSDDGRSNLIFTAQFLDQQPIFAGERDYSKVDQDFDWDAYDEAGRPSGDVDRFLSGSGSSATPGGRLVDRSGAAGNAAWDALNCRFGTCQNGSTNAGDLGAGWRRSGSADVDLYNFQPENYLSTPYQRLSIFTAGNYRINEYLNLFLEGSFSRRDSQQLLAPTPLFTRTEGITVSAENRYNPFGRDFTDVRRRMLEAGNRVFSQEGNTARLVLGVEGNLPDLGPLSGWSWDAYLVYGRTDTTRIIEGRFNLPRLRLALGPDDACRAAGCVALDLFNGPGSITQEMVDYVNTTGVDRGYSEQYVGSVGFGGPLFQLMAEDPVAFSFGYQFRREEGANTPNPLTAIGEASGNKVNPTFGFFEVNSVFAEISAPLISGMRGVEQLEVSAAARFVDFNTFGSELTYKFGIRYNPTDFLAIRGTFSTAFRAPNIFELFGGAQDSFPSVTDPCSTVNGQLSNPIVAANCAAAGVEGGVLDDRTQILTREGGFEGLEAETAETFTFGVVFEDKLIKGLTASVDFYSIEIDNALEQIGAGIILASCFQASPENQEYCNLIPRDENGLITNIIDTETNVGGFVARGIDFELRYNSRNYSFGRIGAGLEGSILVDFAQIQGSGFEQNYKGNYDQAVGSTPGANPDYRLNAFLRWSRDIFNAGANFRYLPSFVECESACSVDSATPSIQRDIDSYFYMDLFAGVNLESPLGTTSITLGMNNVTDIAPPYIANGFTANSDPATYDYAGRSFYARLTQQF